MPPAANAACVWPMEALLDVSTRPDDPKHPLVCVAETSRQGRADVVPPRPVSPGPPARQDDEDVRHGVGNRGLVSDPLRGWRQSTVSDRRTRAAFAPLIRALVEVHAPAAERMALGLDHLNPQTPAALAEPCAPAEAQRLTERLEIHSTPTHGSWLNRAERALSVLARQWLDRRRPARPTLEREVAAWATQRHTARQTIAWRFTTAEARLKRKRLDPAIHD